MFGSLVSATDPVSTLAVFSSLGAHPMVHSVVLGESIMNDAVAIVLFRTLEKVRNVFVFRAAPLAVLRSLATHTD